MKKIFFVSALLTLTITGFTQYNNPEKYAALITGEGLKKHLTIIAGDEMQGRETGTEGQRKAASYIETQFKNIGLLKPDALKSYQQLYPLHQDSLLSTVLKIGNITATYGKDYITPLGSNENGKFKASQLVFAGYGIDDAAYSDYTGLNVKGKVVVFFLGEPRKEGKYFINPKGIGSEWTYPGLNKKMAAAIANGAVGAIVINPNQEAFTQRAIDNTRRLPIAYPKADDGNKKLNYAIVSHAFAKTLLPTADAIFAAIKTSQPFTPDPSMQVNSTIEFAFTKYRDVINASNVLGIIEGTDKKDEYIFLTAHYDHLGMHDGKIYYGADDDGSGTCAVIQMAEAFTRAAAEGKRPRRTMVFMTVSGEEKGLWGSQYYSENPIYPLDKTSVDLNTDMIGRTDTEKFGADSMNYVYVVGHDKISSELPVINEGVNNKYTNLVLDYKFDDPNDPERIYFRSDHYNFARKGVPVLFFYDGMLKADYHKPSDTVDKINWDLYEKRARMIFHTAWEMANRDDMLKRDKPLPTATR